MTLSVFLIPYFILVFIWLIFSLLIFGTFMRFKGDVPHLGKISMTYLIGVAIVLIVSAYFMIGIDWSTSFISFS